MSKQPSRHIWYELLTTDVDAAEKFYGSVVGWSVVKSDQPGMDYRQWTMDGDGVGGLMAISTPTAADAMPPIWLGYLNVPDVDQSVAAIQAAGGAVHMPANTIPGVGRMAMVSDPQGALFYVMAPQGEGVSTAFARGRPGHGGWNELHTTDAKAALGFYGEQFGWKPSTAMDMGPMGTYQLIEAGDGDIGAMFNNPAFPRPAWLYYFNVDDIMAAKARVEAGGGSVNNGPMEVPTGDWIVQCADPQGAMFALVGPNKN